MIPMMVDKFISNTSVIYPERAVIPDMLFPTLVVLTVSVIVVSLAKNQTSLFWFYIKVGLMLKCQPPKKLDGRFFLVFSLIKSSRT